MYSQVLGEKWWNALDPGKDNKLKSCKQMILQGEHDVEIKAKQNRHKSHARQKKK